MLACSGYGHRALSVVSVVTTVCRRPWASDSLTLERPAVPMPPEEAETYQHPLVRHSPALESVQESVSVLESDLELEMPSVTAVVSAACSRRVIPWPCSQ